MPEDRKQIVLRLDQELYEQVKDMAEYYSGPRGVTATILRYIRQGVATDQAAMEEAINSRERAQYRGKGAGHG